MGSVRWRALVATMLLFAVPWIVGPGAVPAVAQDGAPLVGTFAIAPGSCSPAPAGSYFRMVHPTGTPAQGPFVDNGDSSCGDTTYTLLAPGTDGGLVTGSYQPAPSPAFDGAGNSLATRIIEPVRFFSVAFSGSTDPTDRQSGTAAPAPTLRHDGGRLSGDLSAFAATWNDQAFNQGAPKPGGGQPGNTTPVAGTYDATTGAFSVTWASQIVGGPFNNFTGVWHLEGTFRPAGAAAPSTPQQPGPGAGAASPGATGDPAAPDAGEADVAAPLADPATGSGAPVAPRPPGAGAPAGVTVSDDGYEAPTWLVVLLALAGIAGVVTLLAIGRPPVRFAGTDLDDEPSDGPSKRGGRRWPLRTVAAIGIGLALAPAVFQMFSRAPGGGEMIDDFAPHMEASQISGFEEDLATIDAARAESVELLAAAPDGGASYQRVVAFDDAWPAIYDDMGSMLGTMRDNIDNYDGVAALPPFALFPWFFVLPGVLLAAVAVWSLRVDGARPRRGRRVALAVLSVGLLLAPVAFQMFTRAPGGAQMIDDFRPFMTEDKVTEIQGYFLTIGAGEAELRRRAVPALAGDGTADIDAIATFGEAWPDISNGMAPMIGTMADNVDRFAGIAALPPFWLFPWFFVLPGLLVLGLLRLTRPRAADGALPARGGAIDPVPEGA